MIKDEIENPRHLPRVSMRGTWYLSQVHPDGLEPSTNGLRGHGSKIYPVLYTQNLIEI